MRIVVALGGNALLKRGETPDAVIQQRHVVEAARSLAPLAAAHELLICHGNGPQVGLLALESDADRSLTQPYPLDVLGAQTQGMIGYWLAQALHNAGVTRPVVGLITQTVIDPADAAFTRPTKFVGAVYDHATADRLAAIHGWRFSQDGYRWRRVVASPDPQRIVEAPSIANLLGSGAVVICAGGGGIPVSVTSDGRLEGVAAVVDKDLAAAMLAIELHADRLLILTDVAGVMRDFDTPHAAMLTHTYPDELATLQFPAGSMGPKITACRRFVEATGNEAAIGSLTEATSVLAGVAGTTIAAHRCQSRPSR